MFLCPPLVVKSHLKSFVKKLASIEWLSAGAGLYFLLSLISLHGMAAASHGCPGPNDRITVNNILKVS